MLEKNPDKRISWEELFKNNLIVKRGENENKD